LELLIWIANLLNYLVYEIDLKKAQRAHIVIRWKDEGGFWHEDQFRDIFDLKNYFLEKDNKLIAQLVDFKSKDHRAGRRGY